MKGVFCLPSIPPSAHEINYKREESFPFAREPYAVHLACDEGGIRGK